MGLPQGLHARAVQWFNHWRNGLCCLGLETRVIKPVIKPAMHIITVVDVERNLLAEQEARASRVEAVTVDRSWYALHARREWCPEAARAEQWLSVIREEATLADRIYAYRKWFLGCDPC